MHEEVLARFFEGRATAAELAEDLDGSEYRLSEIESVVKIADMQREVIVTRAMAIALCDAVLREELQPSSLAIVGFALMTSDRFSWNGEDLLGDVVADWACPEINYSLDLRAVKQFRGWLLEAEPYPRKPGTTAATGRVISVRRKQTIQA